MVLILNGAGLTTLRRYRDEVPHAAEHLGKLARPRHAYRLAETLADGFAVAFDNDAFSGWSEDRFAAMVCKIERTVWPGHVVTWRQRLAAVGLDQGPRFGLAAAEPLPAWPGNLLWVTVPDAPFDARHTLNLWGAYAGYLSHLPTAFCVQDGARPGLIPWDWPNLACLFIAGSTDFKLSATAADIAADAKARGLWVHVGRVNMPDRIEHVLSLGCVDSFDGSGFDRWRDTHLPGALARLAQHAAGRPVQQRVVDQLLPLDLSR